MTVGGMVAKRVASVHVSNIKRSISPLAQLGLRSRHAKPMRHVFTAANFERRSGATVYTLAVEELCKALAKVPTSYSEHQQALAGSA